MSVSGIGGGAGWAAYAARGLNTIGVKTEAGSDVDELRKKGLVTYAKDIKKEAWLKKLQDWRDEAMKAMGLTQEKLDSMSPDARAKALQQVEEYIQRKIKDAMEAAREDGKRKGGPDSQMSVPQFIDLSV